MKDKVSEIDQRIAARVRYLRKAHALSLDALAAKSGVSRSMISLIERGEASPTAVVLEKLSSALGATLASLFDPTTALGTVGSGPVARRNEQSKWKDPASGYERRNLSPPAVPQPLQLVEVHFPAGARVAFETGVRQPRVYQQIWVIAGAIDITVGDERHRLLSGDCLAMNLDQPTIFHNPTRKAARYLVATASEFASRRSL